jgi:hypothetical protein
LHFTVLQNWCFGASVDIDRVVFSVINRGPSEAMFDFLDLYGFLGLIMALCQALYSLFNHSDLAKADALVFTLSA